MRTTTNAMSMAQYAMENLLTDLLHRRSVCGEVGVSQVTRLDGDRPCWHLWTEDGKGFYLVELKDVGQVVCGRTGSEKRALQEMEADFVMCYYPLTDVHDA